MIVYNSFLAKLFLGRKKHSMMLFGVIFTKHRNMEFYQEMEMRIYKKQYDECLSLIFLPILILGFFISWWLWAFIPLTYYLLYGLEKLVFGRSIFDWEAKCNCYDALYLRKRKGYTWLKHYGKKMNQSC